MNSSDLYLKHEFSEVRRQNKTIRPKLQRRSKTRSVRVIELCQPAKTASISSLDVLPEAIAKQNLSCGLEARINCVLAKASKSCLIGDLVATQAAASYRSLAQPHTEESQLGRRAR
jgi:hypothetical protein